VLRALVHAAAAWHRNGWTPLLLAATNGRTNTVELLVQMGAAVNTQDNWG
jgi:ankyrin repeat protein